MQVQLNKSKRNSHVYDRIASEMKDSGFERSETRCNNKIKELRHEYKKRKDDKNKFGASSLPWTFYAAIDCVLGHRPAICQPVTIDSSRTTLLHHHKMTTLMFQKRKMAPILQLHIQSVYRILLTQIIQEIANWMFHQIAQPLVVGHLLPVFILSLLLVVIFITADCHNSFYFPT